jgi:transposase InsO family protein
MPRRNTQEALIAMKKGVIEKCIKREILCKEGAKILRMHPKALSRLKRRFLEQGETALVPKKPGPKKGKTHNRTPEKIEKLVEYLSDKYWHLGPVPLAEHLFDEFKIKLSSVTIWRILKRRGKRYFRDYEPQKKKDWLFYSLDIPGEELQLDGFYPFGKSRKIVVLSAIDDCSRYVFCKCYTRETANNAIKFVSELINRVPFKIQRIRVDNRYGKLFRQYCEKILNIKVIENDAYTPKQNGKIERFNKTLKYDFFWRYCSYWDSFETLGLKLATWLYYYNYQRQHGGYKMNRLTPAQKIAQTLFYSLVLTINAYPQKVTGTMKQHIS